MTAAALAAVLLLVGAASAGAAFVIEGSPYTVGDDPLSLNAADFNGDGRPDVATINGTSSNVSVFLRQAGGGFAQEAGSPISVGVRAERRGGRRLQRRRAGGPRGVDLQLPGQPCRCCCASRAAASRSRARRSSSARPTRSPRATSTATDGSTSRRRPPAASSCSCCATPRTPASPRARSSRPGRPRSRSPSATTTATGWPTWRSPTGAATTSTILLRVPGGTFSPEAAVPAGDDPIGIVAADFDGNGRADLAVTNAAPGTVSAFLRRPSNDGFDAEPPISVSASPVGIDAADFDRDGRPDLAVAANAGAVEILRRNAGGGFTRDQPIPLAGAVNDVAAADFDGDSRPDLAASSYTNAATRRYVHRAAEPGASAGPDAAAAGRRQDRQRQAGVRHGEDQAAGEQALRHADRGGPDPGRQLDRHAPRADHDHRRPGRGQDGVGGLLRRTVQAHPDQALQASPR